MPPLISSENRVTISVKYSKIRKTKDERNVCMKKKTASKMISFLLAACITVSALPLSAFAAEEQSNTAFSPKRFFIVSGEKPDGTELAQKVSLASAEFQAKGICDLSLIHI